MTCGHRKIPVAVLLPCTPMLPPQIVIWLTSMRDKPLLPPAFPQRMGIFRQRMEAFPNPAMFGFSRRCLL